MKTRGYEMGDWAYWTQPWAAREDRVLILRPEAYGRPDHLVVMLSFPTTLLQDAIKVAHIQDLRRDDK